jgi:hypothetical protein
MIKKSRKIDNFFPIQSPGSESGSSTRASNNIPHVIKLRPGDIVSDSGLRKPIKNLDQKIRNIARREPTN